MTAEEEEFYAGFKPMPKPGPTLEIGCRVEIGGDHPHAGRVGTLEDVQDTIVGTGLVIRFDNGDGAFVFKKHKIRIVALAPTGGGNDAEQ